MLLLESKAYPITLGPLHSSACCKMPPEHNPNTNSRQTNRMYRVNRVGAAGDATVTGNHGPLHVTSRSYRPHLQLLLAIGHYQFDAATAQMLANKHSSKLIHRGTWPRNASRQSANNARRLTLLIIGCEI